MSYAFDVLSSAWEHLKASLPPEQRDSEVATRFGFLIEEMHDANHRLRDAVNKDESVTADAGRLQRALEKAKAGQ